MARNYPATTRLQTFYQEEYDNEMYNRLRTFYAKQRGGDETGSAGPKIGYRGASTALPQINPGKFAREMAKKEKADLEHTIAEARKSQSAEEMRKAPRDVTAKLYEGFTKEGKGRYAYLKDRHQIIPEQKYAFPVLSSWKYGWQLDKEVQLKKPQFARSKKIMDTFYTRNNIPDLSMLS